MNDCKSDLNPSLHYVVAAFDFDGTITYRDTLVPFLYFVFGKKRTLLGLLALSPVFFLFCLGRLKRDQVKEKIFSYFFKGMPLANLEEMGRHFAETELRKKIKKEALRRIAWHQAQQHRVILISASIDLYLKPWTQFMGFDDCLCTSLETDEQGLITGKLKGFNCRGMEKVKRLETLLGIKKDQYILYAYGDSAGDKELLQLADHSYYREMP